ncbi:MAG: beta-lactamase family protein [Phycisphaeraceae bacterium]|nr:beta-lactamase family protein [Phycisphaeraceae bacterium]
MRIVRIAACMTACALIVCADARAQTGADGAAEAGAASKAEVRDVSALLAPIIEKHDVPGMVAGIVVGGRLIAAGAAGVRARGEAEHVTLDDRFHIGSCTKAMTATMCAVQVERGTLRWDLTMAEAFPDLAAKMHEQYKGVTLAQLLSNRGGVPSDLNAGGLWGRLWAHRGTPREARRMLLEGLISRAPAHEPGTKDLYSNAGFAIAGHMAETVAGKDYEDLMQELVFGPLGMTACGWGAPGDAETIDQPRGHERDGKPVQPAPWRADNPPAISPAGRLHCTLGDWGKFISLHLRGEAANPNRAAAVLRPETFDTLHTPPDSLSEYAFGWARPVRPWARGEVAGATGRVLTHGGSNTMWFCVTWVAPERDFAVLIMCNQAERGDKACDEAAWALIQEQIKTARR